MNTHIDTRPSWSTSAFGGAVDTPSSEAVGLGEHVHVCRGLSGRFFAVHCATDRMRGFMAVRVVSTALVAIVLLSALAWLIL